MEDNSDKSTEHDFKNEEESRQLNTDSEYTRQGHEFKASEDYRRLNMDDNGRMHVGGTVGVAANESKIFIILGWISAALTAFASPVFVIPGIIFGIVANMKVRGRGNAVIITNVVLAVINIIFSLFLISAARKILGY